MNANNDNNKALLEGDFQRILQASDSSLKNGEKPFPRAEFQFRQDRLRKMMQERGIELLLVNEPVNIGYLTGFDTIFPGSWMYLGLPLNGEPWMIAADIELTCARYFTYLENLEYMVGPERGDNVLPGEQLMNCIKKYGQAECAIGVELDMPSWGNGRSMTIRDYEILKKGLPKANFLDASGLVNQARIVKTDLEIAALRQAGLYTVAGHKAAFKALRPGMTEAEIAGLAYGATFAAGGEQIGNQGLVAVGEKSGFAPHIPWKRHPIQMGDTVYIEHAGVHNNYNCPQMRSAILGRPSSVQEKADEVLQAVMQNTISNMKPGRLCTDVAMNSRRLLESFNLPDDVLPGDNFGYSVGFGMPPSWCPDAPVAFIEGCDIVLEHNMVFHTTTYVYSPGKCAFMAGNYNKGDSLNNDEAGGFGGYLQSALTAQGIPSAFNEFDRYYDDVLMDWRPERLETLEVLNGANNVYPQAPDTDTDGLSNTDEGVHCTTDTIADTDGDGFEDGVEVAFGTSPTDNTSLPPAPVYVISGNAVDENMAGDENAVANAGDVNNDGVNDVIIGSPYSDALGRNSGRVVVISGANGTTLYNILGDQANASFGTSVRGAGDVNNDGFADFIVGSPDWDFDVDSDGTVDTNVGRAQVFSGATGAELLSLTGSRRWAYHGHSVDGVGDVNGDGKDDVIVGDAGYIRLAAAGTLSEATVYSGADGSVIFTH